MLALGEPHGLDLLGHALDNAATTDAERAQYRTIRGLDPNTRWWGCDWCSDYETVAGDFSEVFGVHLVDGGDFRSRLGGVPSPEQLNALAPLFSL